MRHRRSVQRRQCVPLLRGQHPLWRRELYRIDAVGAADLRRRWCLSGGDDQPVHALHLRYGGVPDDLHGDVAMHDR